MKVKSWIQITFLFLLTVGISGFFSFIGVEPHHHGIMLKPAFDISHGRMLFRDTFTQYGALATILQALAMRIFGNTLMVINLLTAVFYGFVVVLLWLIWSFFLPPLFTSFACLIWLFLAPYFLPDYFFLPWSSVYSLFFQVATLYLLLLFLKTKKNTYMGVAGISAACTFWARQPVGIFLIGSVIVFFIILKVKKYKTPSILPFYLAYFITHAFFFGWLIINRAVPDWWFQTIQFPFLWIQQSFPHYRIPFFLIFANLFSNPIPASNSLLSLWAVLPLTIVYLGYTLLIAHEKNTKQAMLIFCILVCLSSWGQYHPVSDIRHLYWGATPMIGFVLYAIWRFTWNKKNYAAFAVICLLLFAPDLLYRLRFGLRKIRDTSSYVALSQPSILKGMRVPKEEKKEYENAADKIKAYEKKHPRAFITTTGEDALYSMFDGKSVNCFPLTVNWNWQKYNTLRGKKYSQSMVDCIRLYKPLVFSKILYYLPTYQPSGYKQVTDGTGKIYYLLIPE